MEPTCKETEEIKETSKDAHIERRFSEIVPSEEGTRLWTRFEPRSESLRTTVLVR